MQIRKSTDRLGTRCGWRSQEEHDLSLSLSLLTFESIIVLGRCMARARTTVALNAMLRGDVFASFFRIFNIPIGSTRIWIGTWLTPRAVYTVRKLWKT
jgi:hypothetical protein